MTAIRQTSWALLILCLATINTACQSQPPEPPPEPVAVQFNSRLAQPETPLELVKLQNKIKAKLEQPGQQIRVMILETKQRVTVSVSAFKLAKTRSGTQPGPRIELQESYKIAEKLSQLLAQFCDRRQMNIQVNDAVLNR